MVRHRRARGLDAYELAVLRGPGQETGVDGEDDEGRPPPLPKFTVGRFKVGPLGLVMGVLILIVVGSAVKYGGGPPDLAASCSTAGLRLAVNRIVEHAPVEYTAVGPDAGPVLLAIDAAGVRPDLSLVPLPGGTPQRLGVPRRLAGCRVQAAFGVQVPPGKHTVTLFRLTPTGSAVLATAALVVTDRSGLLTG